MSHIKIEKIKNSSGIMKHREGFTLSEMLMTVLIICLVIVLLGGGTSVIKNAYDKVTAKAEAQTILSTAVTMVTDEFRYATAITLEKDGSYSFDSGVSGCRIWFDNDSDKGIIKCRTNDTIPLLTKETMAEELIPSIKYDYDSGTKLFNATISIYRDNKKNAFVEQTIHIKPVNN